MVWSWQYVATFVERDYGAYVDWDEEFFECPECGELLEFSLEDEEDDEAMPF